jgi:hypothetical protein
MSGTDRLSSVAAELARLLSAPRLEVNLGARPTIRQDDLSKPPVRATRAGSS